MKKWFKKIHELNLFQFTLEENYEEEEEEEEVDKRKSE